MSNDCENQVQDKDTLPPTTVEGRCITAIVITVVVLISLAIACIPNCIIIGAIIGVALILGKIAIPFLFYISKPKKNHKG